MGCSTHSRLELHGLQNVLQHSQGVGPEVIASISTWKTVSNNGTDGVIDISLHDEIGLFNAWGIMVLSELVIDKGSGSDGKPYCQMTELLST